jgi:hypothetical protein
MQSLKYVSVFFFQSVIAEKPVSQSGKDMSLKKAKALLTPEPINYGTNHAPSSMNLLE